MKRLKITNKILTLITCFVCLTSFKENPKPHLIVGTWKIAEENVVTLIDSNSFINQLYFGSNELIASFAFTDKQGKSKNQELRLAYKVYENVDGYQVPVVYFINTCDENFKLFFTIENLTKDSLELKLEKSLCSKDVNLNRETIKFERIAGPPENMSNPEDDK